MRKYFLPSRRAFPIWLFLAAIAFLCLGMTQHVLASSTYLMVAQAVVDDDLDDLTDDDDAVDDEVQVVDDDTDQVGTDDLDDRSFDDDPFEGREELDDIDDLESGIEREELEWIEDDDWDEETARDADDDERDEMDGTEAEYEEVDFDVELGERELVDEEGYLVRSGQIIALDMDDAVVDMVETLGFYVVERDWLAHLNLSVVRLAVPDHLSLSEAITSLRNADGVTVYEYNHLYHLNRAADIENSLVTVDGTIGKVERIGMIDTAIDETHPVFAGSAIEQRSFVGSGPAIDHHGTAVASLLVGRSAEFQGMIPGAHLYAAAVFDENQQATAQGLVRALNWLAGAEVAVINMSLAGPPNHVLKRAIDAVVERGHLIVAAVGNQGPAAPPLYPAAYEGVVAVTAHDQRRRIYRHAGRGEHVDFSAQGVNVRVAVLNDGFDTYSGTSFAAPRVSARLAVGLARPHPQRRDRLIESARSRALDMGRDGFDNVFGYGELQGGGAEGR